MKKLEDIIDDAVKSALKNNVVTEKKEKENKDKEEEEEEDEDVCEKCGGDLVLIDKKHCVCEQCGIQYDIS